ncbi:MAG: plasmid recombination protein [Treponema sp.]|nr:plasmid recombination protein [Spirochaetaceae bacterium]MBQ8777729.1 plasmid recombination protein [Treponema sp.]
MSNFCIMRIKKLHSNSNVGGAISHHLRTRETDNADPELMKNNWFFPNDYPTDQNGKTDKSVNADLQFRKDQQQKAMAMYKKRLPEKVRKNGVRAVEFMMTVSPEVMQRKDFNATKYLNACSNWAREKFGKENVFFIAYHRDETTPHVSLLLTPIDENGKLNARKFFGGRDKMSALQDDFYNSVGKEFGLDRGIKGSKAKHQTIKSYYEKQNQKDQELEKLAEDISQNLPQKKFGQSAESYQQEKEKFIQEKLKPVVKKTIVAEQTDKRLKGLQENFETLVQTKTNCAVAEQTEQIRAEKDNLYNAIWSSKISVRGKNGENITCENGLMQAVKNASEQILNLNGRLDTWRNTSAEELEHIANEYRKYGVDNWEDYEQAKKKKRSRGYGGMSYDD